MRVRWVRRELPVLGLVWLLALFGPVTSSNAQYLYLDADGDGVRTAADQCHAFGPTVIDIWLDTGHNRDGSVAVCKANPATPLNMFSYDANLQASGGAVSYSTFTNRVSQMGLFPPAHAPDSTRFSTGFYVMPLGTILPPGKYLLGTVTVNVTSGTPSIQIVPTILWSNPPIVDYTLFGSSCDGSDYPNSIVLGTDWFDADGLPYGTGGGSNQSPRLSPPADMTVLTGENAIQTITASDPEGQPLTFAKESGPPFMFVATTNQGAGTALGEIRLAPFVSDIGVGTGGVSVTDGAASDQASFKIAVSQAPNHPPYLSPIPKLTVVAGSIDKKLLSAGDADGGTLHFAKAAGPAYVRVRELAVRYGGASAVLMASPTMCDVGFATAAISITDGNSTEQRQVELSVVHPSAPPDSMPLRFAEPGTSSAIGLGDLNRDGNLDVIVTHEDRPTISVFLGRGDGDLAPASSYAVVGLASAIAVADLDRDGNLDVAVANGGGASVSILFGRGDGTLLPVITYETGNGPSGIIAADVNRDGVLDLVTSNQVSSSVSVLLGVGDGTFDRKRDAAAGIGPISLVVGDFNLDGRPDAAVANAVPESVGSLLTILPGLGDGTFGDALRTPITGYPISLSSADWNWDGAIDLAITDIYASTVRTFSGRGDGTFAPPATVATAATVQFPYGSATADLDGDGNADLIVADPELNRVAVLFGNGVGGFANPVFPAGPNISPRTVVIGDLNSDARPDVVVAGSEAIGVLLNRYSPVVGGAEARAFVLGRHRTIPSAIGKTDLCIRMEPVGGSYENTEVDLTSITLRSEGTGSVSEIHSLPSKNAIEGDTDQNGIAEICAWFSQPDLAAIFDQLRGRTTVKAQLTGSLADGRMFCTDVELNILGMAEPPRASFVPNPLNPQSKLRFTTGREGPAKALLYDIHGRLVRTLLDTPRLTAGRHEFPFDGKGDRGSHLPSGVYFYRVKSTEGLFAGRVVILK